MVKTLYINIASNGMTNSTNIHGATMTPAPSSTLEPRLNESALLLNGSTVTVSGNQAIVTNPSPFFSSLVIEYFTLTDIAGNVSGDTIRIIQLNITPFMSNLAGFGPHYSLHEPENQPICVGEYYHGPDDRCTQFK